MTEKIRTLLQEAEPKVREYKAKRKERRLMGHDFNIFSIMGMERSEVKTHSAMIAELLNPRGLHGQEGIFLRRFLEDIKECRVLSSIGKENEKIGGWLSRNAKAVGTAVVVAEKSYPNVEGFGKDNRVDIVIEFENLVILIENKVDAIDQPEQLKRYSGVGKDSGKDYCLLYLTKKGHVASQKSLGSGEVEYDKISYEEHIMSWLNLCLREEGIICRTSLQKAILQYRDTVEKITGTNMNSKFNHEMIELLMESENLECAEEISKFIPKVKGEILFSFFEKVESHLNSEHIGSSVPKYKLSKTMQNRLSSKRKCIEWFYHHSNKQRAKSFGLFFDIGVKDKLFHIMVASRALHYGIVHVEKDKDALLNLVSHSKKDWEENTENFKGLEKRTWSDIKWHSHIYEYKEGHWDFLEHPKEFMPLSESNAFFEGIKNTIHKLKNESPSDVDSKSS